MPDTASIDDREFGQFQTWLYRIAGINLSPAKKALVASRLAKRLCHYELDSYDDYFQLDAAIKDRRWLIFAGHEMGLTNRNQMTNLDALAELIAYARAQKQGTLTDGLQFDAAAFDTPVFREQLLNSLVDQRTVAIAASISAAAAAKASSAAAFS